jgi:hypothetical protein
LPGFVLGVNEFAIHDDVEDSSTGANEGGLCAERGADSGS